MNKKLGSLSKDELKKAVKRNFEIFKKEVLEGKPVAKQRIDVCWFCGRLFTEAEAEFCDKCQTYKCPYCGKCFCDLPPEAQKTLDAEMFSLGLWSPYTNPKRRKKKRKKTLITGWTREDLLDYAKKYFPSLYSEYEAGRMDFEELKDEIQLETGLVWKLK